MKNKLCGRCSVEKSYSEFYKNRCRYDGLESYCKQCKSNYEKNKRKKHRNKYLAFSREYYSINREKILQQKQDQHNKHREKNLARSKKWYEDNKNKIILRKKKRLKKDPYFRLVNCLRNRTRSALRGKNKSAKTMDLIGCSVEELWLHLEKQFTTGMTRENYGFKGWHIDHIMPCASFDLNDPEQQKKCFHYTNLQPLWAKDNHSKGSKITPAE